MFKYNELNIFQWSDILEAAKTLSIKIANDNIPDIVVGIPRGGMIFATLFAEIFNRDLNMVYVSRRINGKEVYEDPIVKFEFKGEWVRGKDILLVDEIIDTGKTLDIARRELCKVGAKSVNTCAIVNRSRGKFKCDYTFFYSDKDNNIFPWDFYVLDDDLKGFKVHDEYQAMDETISTGLYNE